MRSLYVVIAVLVAMASPGATHWNEDLYLGNGGFWKKRVAIDISNPTSAGLDGVPLGIRVGTAAGGIAIAGEDARSFRLCRHDGTELLFALIGPDGERIRDRSVPAGAWLYVPAECAAGGKARYWLYWGNGSAGLVPDFLSVSGELNGGFERGRGSDPAGWHAKDIDAAHRMRWVEGQTRFGKRCVRSDVDDGAKHNWVAYCRTRVPLMGGTRYTLTGWTKGKGVKGFAGWFIHLNHETKSMVRNYHLDAGGGDYDWKKVSVSFVAPTNVTHATIGTVLRGTGTAWFDDLALASEEGALPMACAGTPELLSLREVAPAPEWIDPPQEGWRCRVPVRVSNLGENALSNTLAVTRLAGVIVPRDIVVAHGTSVVPHCLLGRDIMFACNVEPKAINTYHVYVRKRGSTPFTLDGWMASLRAASGRDVAHRGSDIPSDHQVRSVPVADREAYGCLMASAANLARNGSFEEGEETPTFWRPSSERDSCTLARDTGGGALFGRCSARTTLSVSEKPHWTGWHQTMHVAPGQRYLYAGWLRCRDVRNGDIQLHAHCRNGKGELCHDLNYTSAGPAISGTAGWSLCSGRFTMPADAATFDLHLTMNANGTVWHDGVLFAPIIEGRAGAPETPPTSAEDAVHVWPVNPLVKVFRHDVPPAKPGPARVTVARNEKEPLQFAVRAPRRISGVHVSVDSPKNAAGRVLSDVSVGIVGYVPIDYPTSYYRSLAPTWHRRIPRRSPGCDGWPGMWPDPILPRSSFDLGPNQTQPIWLTVSVPVAAQPGRYVGTLKLTADGKVLATVPFTVHVWDFALPARSRIAAIYDVRLGTQWDLPGRTRDDACDALLRFMADNRISGDRVQAEPRFRSEGGAIKADFSDYDRAAALYFDELGMPFSYTPRFFYVFGWAHLPKRVLGEHPFTGEYPYEGADRTELRPEYKRAYQTCLKLYWDHMQAKGWAGKLVLYVSDEPHFHHKDVRDQMKAVCDMIHEVDADIPIYSSTWRHCKEWDGYLDVWGVGHYGCFPKETMAARARDGDRIWITTDGQMCTDTPYCAIERLLPYYCFVHDAEAYEFWGLTWLTYDPYAFGWHSYIRQSSTPGEHYYVRYPNGDGYLLYPGAPIGHDGPVTSLRFEQAREGVEDSEYLFMLRERVKHAASAGGDVARANELLDAVTRLCTIPNAGGRYSTRILPCPEIVPQLKEALAREIQELDP